MYLLFLRMERTGVSRMLPLNKNQVIN